MKSPIPRQMLSAWADRPIGHRSRIDGTKVPRLFVIDVGETN
jgi:hypothetical protein